MEPIKDKIDKLMDQHSIETYVDLLRIIGKMLGEPNTYEFAEKEKSNFTKMLKGQRPLKHDFIIPLEQIFGVPMAKMLYEDEYNTEFSKEDLPFIKGFRYYAYKDDPKLYEEEFEKYFLDREGLPRVCNIDEFNKHFLDYVIEYKAVNAIYYLLNKHNLKASSNSSYWFEIDADCTRTLGSTLKYGLDRLIVEKDLVDVFTKIYDPYYVYIYLRYPYPDSIYNDDLFLEGILKSDKIFNSLFDYKDINIGYANRDLVVSKDDPTTIKVINPLLNICLNYALKNPQKYKEQIIQILEFGIKHNPEAIKSTGEKIEDLVSRDYGNVFYRNDYKMLTNIIDPEIKPDNREISTLIDKLPVIRQIRF